MRFGISVQATCDLPPAVVAAHPVCPRSIPILAPDKSGLDTHRRSMPAGVKLGARALTEGIVAQPHEFESTGEAAAGRRLRR